jgi:signal transduction histidine kinase/HAMP domain-containing protein
MTDILAPLKPEYTLYIPDEPMVWISWGILLGLLVFLLIRFRNRDLILDRQFVFWFSSLSVLVLVFTPFFGIFLERGDSFRGPNDPIQHLMFFAAVPWLVAGGVLGMLPAAMLAGLSGLLLAYLDTHNIFTPLIFMTVAVFFSWSVRQRYRTVFFRLLKIPPIAAIISLVLTLPLVFLMMILSNTGELAGRFASAFNAMPAMIFSFGGMVLIAGMVCWIVKLFFKNAWRVNKPLIPAPGEISLKFRLIATLAPMLLLLMSFLVVFSWIIAKNTARRIMVRQLTSTSSLVVDGLAVYIKTGENLIGNLAAEEGFISGTPEEVSNLLAEKSNTFPFFEKLVLIDSTGRMISGYPQTSSEHLLPKPEEILAIELVVTGTTPQVMPVQSEVGMHEARLSFFASVSGPSNLTDRVLWGQSDILRNSFSHPFMKALDNLAQRGGIGQIVRDDGKILFHTDPQNMTNDYLDSIYTTPTYFENVSSEGISMLQYYQPISNSRLAVVSSLPEQVIDEMAWDMVNPLLLIGLVAILFVLLVALIGFTPVVTNIDKILAASKKVTAGDYHIDLPQDGIKGEIGQLNVAFGHMVDSLRSHTKNQMDLLSVSEQIEGQLGLQDSLQVVAKIALDRGVSSVRIVLLGASDNEISETLDYRFGLGKHTRQFASLDNEILARTRSQGPLVMRDFQIDRTLPITKGMPYPASLISMPLRWEKAYLGVFWVTYQAHRFPDAQEIDFYKKLSQKACVAIVNAKAHEKLITKTMQLESVFNILNDAVVVVDRDWRVVFHNQVAQLLLDKRFGLLKGQKLSTIVTDDLVEMMAHGKQALQSKQVQLADGKEYQIIASPIMVESRLMGQALIFTDITEQNLKESLRKEFVTTVSHELSSPLTLIHGYAKILGLTGNLHEQQEVYISKIIDGVEEMKHLVQNLLDIGRLESGDLLEITQFSLSDFAQNVLDSMEAQAKQKDIQVTASLPESPIVLRGDIIFLTQALKNLIENAIKFTKMGGNVGLSVCVKNESVIFAVRDTGIGIAPLDQRHLFTRFPQINAQVDQEQKGSGLGLSIVKSIAERHGGQVWVESQLGKGSTFFLQIPLNPTN